MHGGDLAVVTIDHGIRPESAMEAEFVRTLAEKHGLPVFQFSLKLGAQASEQQAREARYQVLRTFETVAVAHHAQDQAETVLIQLIRGSGSAGLSGMGWENRGIVRPMLDVDARSIEHWALDHALEWREDASNRDPRFLRSRVRHEALPWLEEVRPGGISGLCRTAERFSLDERYFQEVLQGLDDGVWEVARFVALPEALAARLLLREFPASHWDWTREALAQIRQHAEWIPAPGGGGLRCAREKIERVR